MKVTDKMYGAGMTWLLKRGTNWSCKDLFTVMYNASEITPMSYPTHAQFGTGCCGIFMNLQPEGLFCNECGMEISEIIKLFLERERGNEVCG